MTPKSPQGPWAVEILCGHTWFNCRHWVVLNFWESNIGPFIVGMYSEATELAEYLNELEEKGRESCLKSK